MIIESLSIENFGRLHNCEIHFEQDLTEICRENGSGKSTLCAFIRAMFYGLAGERKKGLADERRRYRPWQGGAFGGRMVFQANGRRYEISRIFGEKSALDEFELRDADTNLPSPDYSERIGEELFLINKETFERTVFIESGDCTAAATDDVNALIGGMQEASDGSAGFAEADERIKDTLNRLSPTRKTGELNKRKDTITHLKQEIKAGERLSDAIGKYSAQLAENRKKADDCRKKAEEITAEQEKESAKNDLRVTAVQYRQLCEAEEKSRLAFEAAKEYFPSDIPEKNAVSEQINRCLALSKLAGQADAVSLDARERSALEYYCSRFSDGVPSSADIEEMRKCLSLADKLTGEQERLNRELEQCLSLPGVNRRKIARQANAGHTQAESRQADTESAADGQANTGRTDAGRANNTIALVSTFLMLFGLIELIVGILSGGFGILFQMAQLCVGAVLMIVGAVLAGTNNRKRALQKQTEANACANHRQVLLRKVRTFLLACGTNRADVPSARDDAAAKDTANEAANEAPLSPEELSARLDHLERDVQEFARLSDQQKNYAALLGEYRAGMEETASFLAQYSAEAPADTPAALMQQLNRLFGALDTYRTAGKAYAAAAREREAFEKKHNLHLPDTTASDADASDMPASDMSASGTFGSNVFGSIASVSGISALAKTSEPNTLRALQQQKKKLDEERDSLQETIRQNQKNLERLREEYDEWAEKKEQLADAQEEYARLEGQYKIIRLTRKYLQEAKEQLTLRYSSPVLESFRHYFGCFSEEIGAAMRIDASLTLTREEQGKQREIETQSSGLREMMGFCLRIAYADAMYCAQDVPREKPPLIFDDPFVFLDEQNAAAGQKLLKEIAKKYQVICLSCR